MPNQFNSPEGDLENYFVSEYWLIDQWVGDTLWVWGVNSSTSGNLGDNTSVNRSTPVTTIAGGTNWKQVANGSNHTVAVKTDGTLWGWGRNDSGQTGTDAGSFLTSINPVSTLTSNWKQVSCGNSYTAAVKTDGTLWVWGSPQGGRLGNNENTINYRFTPVTTFAGGTNWKQVACGNAHTAAIKTDGTLWTWGTNSSGQLGDNTTTNRLTPVTTFAGGTNWKQVANGSNHTAAIKTDGTLWTWGSNTNGELGDNTTTQRNTPVTTFAGGTNWKQVAGGINNTAAIKTDGTLWIWGNNSSGNLGDNTTISRSTPVTTFAGGANWKQVSSCIGGNHTAAIRTSDDLQGI